MTPLYRAIVAAIILIVVVAILCALLGLADIVLKATVAICVIGILAVLFTGPPGGNRLT